MKQFKFNLNKEKNKLFGRKKPEKKSELFGRKIKKPSVWNKQLDIKFVVSIIVVFALATTMITAAGLGSGAYTVSGAISYLTGEGYVALAGDTILDKGVLFGTADSDVDSESAFIYDYDTNTLSVDNLDSPTGRTATYVVAASNAPDHVKQQADYVCNGTNDEVEINAAIEAVANGYSTNTISISGATVTGSETTFTADMAGWYLRTAGGDHVYRISAYVDVDELKIDKSSSTENNVSYMLNRGGMVRLSTGVFTIGTTSIDMGKYSGIKLVGEGSGVTRLLMTDPDTSVIAKTTDEDGQDCALIGFEACIKEGVSSITANTIDLTNTAQTGDSRNWVIDDIQVNNSAVNTYGFAASDCRQWYFGHIYQRYGGGFMHISNTNASESTGNFQINSIDAVITLTATVPVFYIEGGDTASPPDYLELFHISSLNVFGATDGNEPLVKLKNVRECTIDQGAFEPTSGGYPLAIENGTNLSSYDIILNNLYFSGGATKVTIDCEDQDIRRTVTFNNCNINDAFVEIGTAFDGNGTDNGSWGVVFANCRIRAPIKGYCTVVNDKGFSQKDLHLDDLYAPAGGFSDNTCYLEQGCIQVNPDYGTATFTANNAHDALITRVGGTDNYVSEWFVNHIRGKSGHRYGLIWSYPYYQTITFQIDTEDNYLTDTEIWFVRGDRSDDYVGIKIVDGSVYIVGSGNTGSAADDTGVDIAEGEVYTLFISKGRTISNECDYGFAIRGWTKIDAEDWDDQATYLGTIDESEAPYSPETSPTYILNHYMQTTDDSNQWLQSRIYDFEFLYVPV